MIGVCEAARASLSWESLRALWCPHMPRSVEQEGVCSAACCGEPFQSRSVLGGRWRSTWAPGRAPGRAP